MTGISARGLASHTRSDNCNNLQLVNRTKKALEAEGWSPIDNESAAILRGIGLTLRWDLAFFSRSHRRWIMDATYYAPQWAANAVRKLSRFIIWEKADVLRLLMLGEDSAELQNAVAVATIVCPLYLNHGETMRLYHLGLEIGAATPEFTQAVEDASTFEALQEMTL